MLTFAHMSQKILARCTQFLSLGLCLLGVSCYETGSGRSALQQSQNASAMPAISNYRDGIAFAILILILLFRPAGLLGKAQVEKV